MIAMYGQVETHTNDYYGQTYYLKIEEHYGDHTHESKRVVYDLTGFYSRIIDVQFQNDCYHAHVFMWTLQKNPFDDASYMHGDKPYMLYMKLPTSNNNE